MIDAAKAVSDPDRPRDPARAAAGVRGRRPGRHRRPDRHDRHRLEVNVHVITCSVTSAAEHRHLRQPRAGSRSWTLSSTQLAAAEASSTPDEKELGVALVDIGGGTTDLAIFQKGSLWHTAVLPGRRRALHERRGGRRCARRSARPRRSSRSTAARSPRWSREEDSIEVPSVGGRNPRMCAAPGPGRRSSSRAREEVCQLVAHRDPARRLRAQPQQRRRAHRRRRDPRRPARDRRADLRLAGPARNALPASAASWTWWRARSTRRRSASCCVAIATARAAALGGGRSGGARGHSAGHGRLMGWLSDFFLRGGDDGRRSAKASRFRPLPVPDRRVAREARGPFPIADSRDLPCEMCGARRCRYHCKRICLHCGFMTGCSEGI